LAQVLPVVLDVGTNNEALRNDQDYVSTDASPLASHASSP